MVQRIEEILGAALLALPLTAWLIVGYWPKPKDISVPTQLEKTCFVPGPGLYWAGCLAYIMWCEAAFRVLSQDADI